MNKRQIKKTRILLGMSQEQFAHAIGVTAMTVSRWERGIIAIRPIQVARINEKIKPLLESITR